MNEPPEKFEAELMVRIARGDREAFELLYDRHSVVLYSLLLKILNSPSDAEDVLQEAFLLIWDKAGSFDPALGKPLSWTIALTRNKALDRLRSVQRRQEVLNAVAAFSAETPNDGAAFFGGELGRMVQAAVEKLADEQRQAIQMAFFRGFSQSEIAEALQIPLGTVKARIRRGMLKLRAELEHYL